MKVSIGVMKTDILEWLYRYIYSIQGHVWDKGKMTR